jgi:hypothetical protein
MGQAHIRRRCVGCSGDYVQSCRAELKQASAAPTKSAADAARLIALLLNPKLGRRDSAPPKTLEFYHGISATVCIPSD